jgi:hypothetical protein
MLQTAQIRRQMLIWLMILKEMWLLMGRILSLLLKGKVK